MGGAAMSRSLARPDDRDCIPTPPASSARHAGASRPVAFVHASARLTMSRHHRTIGLLVLLVAASSSSCSDTASPASGTPRTGDVAPLFTQADTSGRPVSLESFKGRVVMIDFWATWCGPCIAALPAMKSLWQDYRDRNFALISVSLDYNLDTWRRFVQENRLDWVHTSDGRYFNNAVAALYGVDAIPAVYLIDRSGRIRAIRAFVDASVRRQIDTLLSE